MTLEMQHSGPFHTLKPLGLMPPWHSRHIRRSTSPHPYNKRCIAHMPTDTHNQAATFSYSPTGNTLPTWPATYTPHTHKSSPRSHTSKPRPPKIIHTNREPQSRVQLGDSATGSKQRAHGYRTHRPTICHTGSEKQRSSMPLQATGRDRSKCGNSAVRSTTIPLGNPLFWQITPCSIQCANGPCAQMVCSWALVSYRTVVLRVRQ